MDAANWSFTDYLFGDIKVTVSEDDVKFVMNGGVNDDGTVTFLELDVPRADAARLSIFLRDALADGAPDRAQVPHSGVENGQHQPTINRHDHLNAGEISEKR